MREQIESILEGLPAVKIEQVGLYWRINVANLVGAREDGISLANDLKAQYQARQAREAYKVSQVHVMEPVPVPEKAPEPETIPLALADLIRENEAYGEAQARLWALYVSLQNKLMLGIASEADARLHTRLHGHLAWISKGAAEVVR
jgi:hypothetical protein